MRFDLLKALWEHLESVLERLGSVLERLGSVLGRFGSVLGAPAPAGQCRSVPFGVSAEPALDYVYGSDGTASLDPARLRPGGGRIETAFAETPPAPSPVSTATILF